MRNVLFAALAFTVTSDMIASGTGASKVDLEDLRSGTAVIVGELGLPIGTPTEVEGTVVAVRSPWILGADSFIYRLRVDTVGGEATHAPIVFDYQAEDAVWSLMVQNEDELKKILQGYVRGATGDKITIKQSEADDLLSGYTSLRRKLLVYETVWFLGRPMKLPANRPPRKARPFEVGSFLVVIQPDRPVVEELANLSSQGNDAAP